MKSKLFRLLSICLLTACFASCDKSDDPIGDDPIEKIDKTYKFVSISWRLEEGEGVTTFEQTMSDIFYENRTSIDQPVIFNIRDHFKETSHFECEDNEFFNKWIEEDVLVSIPTVIELSRNYTHLIGGDSASLSMGETMEIVSSLISTRSTELHPNHVLQIKASAEMKDIKASFLLHFIENTEGVEFPERIEIKGKWTGRAIGNKVNTGFTYNEIKE